MARPARCSGSRRGRSDAICRTGACGWSDFSPAPALLDSSLYPSRRSVERCSTHEGPPPLDPSTLETTPVGRASARRARSRIRRCTQAVAASSDARPTKGPRHWIHRCRKQPPWVGLQPDAGAPGFVAAPTPSQRRAMLDPRRAPATGPIDAGNNPRGSSLSSTPAFLDSSLRPRHRSVERCSTHEGPRHWSHRRWKQAPWVELQLDARAPGFAAAPTPSPRRAMLDPRGTSPLDPSTLETTPVGRAMARRLRARTRRCTQAIAASSDARPTKDLATGSIDAGNNRRGGGGGHTPARQ
jgi:hypothetical protein